MTELVALIPLRAGSRGLPGKNVRPLAGRPLWRHAVEQAQGAGADRVVVSTNIPEVLDTAPEPGLTLLRRPDDLAQDTTPMAPVVLDAIARAIAEEARVVLLQATSPLRSVEDIEGAVALHQTGGYDLVKTVTATDSGVLKYGMLDGDRFAPLSDPAYCFANRQSLPPVYRPNGAVYVFNAGWFARNGGFATANIGAVVMPPERSFDIDSEDDFARVEAALMARKSDPADPPASP